MSRLEALHDQGFDLSVAEPEEGTIKVRCSGCAALVINGVPCHERGCPNQNKETDDGELDVQH